MAGKSIISQFLILIHINFYFDYIKKNNFFFLFQEGSKFLEIDVFKDIYVHPGNKTIEQLYISVY